jgi:hypothetical protein
LKAGKGRRASRAWLGALAVVAIAGWVGCRASGSFDASGYHNALAAYTVRYAEPAERSLLSSDWVVENFYSDDKGAPTQAKIEPHLKRDVKVELADGSTSTLSLDLYDLKLVHKASDAVIWLRSIPLSPRQPNVALRVLADEYAESISGAGFFASDLGTRHVESRTYASHVLSGRPVQVAGLEAYETTIEVANVDQLKLDPASRVAMVRVVLVRTPLWIWTPTQAVKLPLLWMVGYANNPIDFEPQSGDFVRFLGLIDQNGSHGFSVFPSGSASAPASAPAPASASASAPAPASAPTSASAPATAPAPSTPF